MIRGAARPWTWTRWCRCRAAAHRCRRPADPHGSALYRLLANRPGDRFRAAEPASVLRKSVEASATADVNADRIEITLGRRVHNPH